ncbi:MAG: extracellular solute-binding protein [Lachnospiraceae bacterium]|nr:extracellular solute-binding protein [Lachnospiraceae bacterium]
MYKKIRQGTAFFLSAVIAAGLFGCGQPSSGQPGVQSSQPGQAKEAGQPAQTNKAEEESKSTDKVNVTMAVWSSSSAAIQEEAAKVFNDSQDQINFTVEMQSGDYAQYLGAKTVANDLPDLFYINPYSELWQYAKNGYLLDLSDQPFASKIYDSTKEGVTYDGKIYGYPSSVEYWGLFYNIDAFEKAGITEPPVTFSQLQEACEKLKAVGITPFAATYKDSWTCEQVFCALYAGAMQDRLPGWVADMNAGKSTFSQEGVDKVFRFIDLMKENSGTNYMDSDATAGYNSFAGGDAAMIFLGNFALRSARKVNPDIRLGMLPVPISDNPEESKIMCNTGVGIVVNPNGKHVEEALKVLEYVSDNTEGARNWTTIMLDAVGGAMPSMPVKLENVVNEPYYQTASQYIAEGKTMGKISNQLNSGGMEIIKNVIQGYFADMSSQEEILGQLDEQILKLAE